jgi:hypothetical protein
VGADLRPEFVEHMCHHRLAGSETIVFVDLGQDRQGADVMHQTAEHGLLAFELRDAGRQHMTDGGHLQAVVPKLSELPVQGILGGLKDLPHRQADDQASEHLQAQPGDRLLDRCEFHRSGRHWRPRPACRLRSNGIDDTYCGCRA